MATTRAAGGRPSSAATRPASSAATRPTSCRPTATRNRSPATSPSPKARQLIRRLAEKCDIVVENYKVGTLARYGLDYASLRAINPRLIYCSITGFGQTGPYAPRPGYDFVFQGMGGLMSITGVPDGQPGAGADEGGRGGGRPDHRDVRHQRDPGCAGAAPRQRQGPAHRHRAARLPDRADLVPDR